MITKEALAVLPVRQSPFIAGGVFSRPLCFEFAISVHACARHHVGAMEELASGDAQKMALLTERVQKWSRSLLIEETEAWLTRTPQLSTLYQYTYTQLVQEYVKLFPDIKERGLRIPGLCDFIMCFLVALFEDPRVRAAAFTRSDHSRTFAIVVERLGHVFNEAVTSIYFPRYRAATSAFSRMEPELRALETPLGARAISDPPGEHLPDKLRFES
jgi:hypothetical protein